MKILVTGSKGFIGQNMMERLRGYDVAGYDILDEYKRPAELKINQFDQVIHLGAISSTTETNVQKIMDLNVSWAIELFEECSLHGVNFQWSSSASVYGKVHTFCESQQMQPENLYARSKMLLENYITSRSDTSIVWQGFRYFNVFGKYEDHKGTQSSPHHQFTKQAQETGVIRVFEGSENFMRDFVTVETVCDYHEKFMKHKVCGVFNVGTGTPKSFLQVAEEVADKHSASIATIPFPQHLKSHYQSYTCADMRITYSTLSME
jgi:ADP-L-glycero-D-manno-heptose 6-epimerase